VDLKGCVSRSKQLKCAGQCGGFIASGGGDRGFKSVSPAKSRWSGACAGDCLIYFLTVRLASTAAVIRIDRWRTRWITTEDVELSGFRATIELGVPQDLPRDLRIDVEV
jgi:hypothetical protein